MSTEHFNVLSAPIPSNTTLVLLSTHCTHCLARSCPCRLLLHRHVHAECNLPPPYYSSRRVAYAQCTSCGQITVHLQYKRANARHVDDRPLAHPLVRTIHKFTLYLRFSYQIFSIIRRRKFYSFGLLFAKYLSSA